MLYYNDTNTFNKSVSQNLDKFIDKCIYKSMWGTSVV